MTVEMVIANLQQNVGRAKSIIKTAVSRIPEARECGCSEALKDSIITAPDRIPDKTKRELALLVGKYLQ